MDHAEIRKALGTNERHAAARQQFGAAVSEREHRALELLVAGAANREIALALGMRSPSAAASLVHRALAKRALQVDRQTLPEARALHLDRLMELYRRWLPLALGASEQPPDAKAADVVLRVLDRIARVQGTEIPQPTIENTTVFVLSPEAVAQRRERVLEQLARVEERQRSIEGEFREVA